ncbi:uncharacterized protein LOC111349020 isoform X4 [Spodoptera litura]|uniref:Uncharacterized protein LOC111349020 isoform X4 n=2 Tax=Spodoptera litura TaxID=69820 RepID=A0A9J7DPB5_SPOLT|nr:uncharacterized protein LOC111349020 isoform X4 [Spodoptera litura]
MRNTWLKLARRDPKSLSTKTKYYFCEDHFDLENDMENYTQLKIMGSVKRIRMRPNCIPSRFDCQPGRKRTFTVSEPRAAFMKRQRLSIIKEIEETTNNETCDTPLSSSSGQGVEHQHKYLKKSAVPSVFAWNTQPVSEKAKISTMNVTTSKASYKRHAYSAKRNSLQKVRGVLRGHYKRDISRLQVWHEEQEKPVKKILGIPDHSDEGGVSELADQPGPDEEVCLLSDIEGEISNTSKAVPEKRKQAERKNTEYEHNKSVEMDVSEIPHIIQIIPVDSTCMQCKAEQPCTYRYITKESETVYLCSQTCANNFQSQCVKQYSTHKKYLIEEIVPKILTCSECEEMKTCYFYCNYNGEDTNYCSMTCLKSMMADETDKYMFKSFIEVKEIAPRGAKCCVCNVHKKCSYSFNSDGETLLICANSCMKTLNCRENGRYVITGKQIQKQGNIPWYNPRTSPRNVPEENGRYMIVRKATRKQTIVPRNVPEENGKCMIKKKITPRKQPIQPQNPSLLTLKVICNATDKYLDEAYKIQAKTPAMVEAAREERERTLQAAREERERTFIRMCYRCQLILNIGEKLLTWENMDFCSELCLGRYQNKIGARCANCKNNVQKTSLGKYCVRFGFDIRQFCNSSCLEEFKKGLKICHYCQQDTSVSHQSFLAPVGEKGQFKDFCSQSCIKKFDLMSKNQVLQPVWAKCAVCSLEKATSIEVEVSENSSQRLCSDTCFTAFKFVNKIVPGEYHI